MSDRACVECGDRLSGNQRKFCSKPKCRTNWHMRRARSQVPSDVARPAPRVDPIEGEYDLGERLLRDMVKRADERRYDREYWRLVDQLGDEDLVGTHPSGVPIDREVHESRVL